MSNKNILGIIWIVVALALLAILVRGIREERSVHKFFRIQLPSIEQDGKLEVPSESCSYPLSEVNRLDVDVSSFSVQVEKSLDGNVCVDFTGQAADYTKVEVSGSKLKLKQQAIRLSNGFVSPSGGILIKVPEEGMDDLTINGVSGSIRIDGVNVPRLKVDNVSGSITVDSCTSKKLLIGQVSGSIKADGDYECIDSESVSGSQNISTSCRDVDSVHMESVSGSVKLALPVREFNFEYTTLSGGVYVNGEKRHGKSGEIETGSRSAPRINVETVSGSISVN